MKNSYVLVTIVAALVGSTTFNVLHNTTTMSSSLSTFAPSIATPLPTISISPTVAPTTTPTIAPTTAVKDTHETKLVSRGGSALNERTSKTITALNKRLEGKLKGMGEVFYTAGERHGVNSKVLAAICMHETTEKGISGNSDLIRNWNNVAGINWEATTLVKQQDGTFKHITNPYKKAGWYNAYPSVADSINDMAQRLRWFYIDEGRTTIDAIGSKWAPLSDPRNGKHGMDNSSWPKSVTTIYNQLVELEEES